MQSAINKLRSLCAEGDKDRGRRKELKRQLSLYQYWQDGLSRNGIPSMLLDAVAPSLNTYVQPYANVLTQGAYLVRFNPAAERGRSTEFKVEASNVEGGSVYEDLSSGERVRVDLCVLFAIRELMQNRATVRFDQVFIDELFDGMDAEGMEYATRLLRSNRIAPQMFFISHHDALKDAAEGSVVVEKVNGISRIAV